MERKEKIYYGWLEEMSTEILKMLNNNILFEKKLEKLKKTIFITLNGTNGVTLCDGTKFEICIDVNPNDTEMFIKLVMAHELAHLLFASINNLPIAGYCASDDSFELSFIKRKTSDGDVYGEDLEELICDYIAVELVKRNFKNKFSSETICEIVFNEKEKQLYNCTKKIVELFGEDISANDKIDSYPQNEKLVQPDNLFLYNIATGTINVLINDYDECMGKGAWKRLNEEISKYKNENCSSAKEFLEIEMKRFLLL